MNADRQLVHLLADCEASRLHLERGIALGLHGDDLAALVAARVAALEALAEYQRLVPVRDDAFLAHDRHVPHQRRNKKTDNAA